MKRLALASFIVTTLVSVLALTAPVASTDQTTVLPSKKKAKKTSVVQALPPKKPAAPKTKRTYIDFSSAESGRELKQEVRIQSRVIVPAPPGDAAEPMSSFSKTIVRPPVVVTKPVAVQPTPTPEPQPTPEPTPEPTMEAAPDLKPAPGIEQQPVIEPEVEESTIVQVSPSPTPTAVIVVATPVTSVTDQADTEKTPSVQTTPIAVSTAAAPQPRLAPATPSTMIFLRTGYLNANYRKFDDRMKNGATSMGLGAARGFTTDWGAFEARAALDAYHAVDQSITIDNLRMLAVRSELAYWLTHSRVKSGLSLGLGWADYSIRSYRSIQGSNEDTVVIRTHAKSRAFAIIPATSLRIELAHDLVIDAQTEFVGLLGGDSSDAAQGLGLTAALGWMF